VSTYFDHNATTPVAPEVVAAMAEALASTFGNASSVHAYGQRAKAAIDDARTSVAALIGAEPAEVRRRVLGVVDGQAAVVGLVEHQELEPARAVLLVDLDAELAAVAALLVLALQL